MKATGIVRKVDELGRIVLPIELRRTLDIAEKDPLAYASGPREGKDLLKLVQVESRCSMTASKADQFLAVAPGTEAALAMGIAHLMVRNGNYDVDFVKNSVFGFEDWTGRHGKEA